MLSVSGIYVALGALLLVGLGLRVARLRHRLGVALGHGGHVALKRAIRVHANCAEYLPVGLVLLVALDLRQAGALWVHVLGAALLSGRVLHALGVSRTREPLPVRVSGMLLTVGAIVGASLRLLLTYV